MERLLRGAGAGLKTLRLALPKVAVGWMFALLTIDFNRVAIVELGVAAVLVTSLLALHYFLSPFQVVAGRIADTHPLFGYRRTPYLVAASVLASLLFPALPGVAQAMGDGSLAATAAAVMLFVVFGLCMAVMADTHHSLIAESTRSETRGAVISVVWVVMILSTIASAIVMNIVRPEYSPEAMQRLYNLTPPVVIVSVLLGVVGLEKRLGGDALRAAAARARALAPPGNPLTAAARLVRGNRQARCFFGFIALAIFALFLQESLIEVLGAEVFGATITETTRYQPTWGAGVLIGMVIMGLASLVVSASKRQIALAGAAAAAVGFLLLAATALFQLEALLLPTLFFMGACAGVFNVGALSLMMDMTVEGATGLYLGLWGVAQALGMGGAGVVAGALHTALIATGLLAPEHGYALLFSAEGALLLAALALLYRVDVADFQRRATAPLANAGNHNGDRALADIASAGT